MVDLLMNQDLLMDLDGLEDLSMDLPMGLEGLAWCCDRSLQSGTKRLPTPVSSTYAPEDNP